MAREMKDSGVDIVGIIPNEWRAIRLKYLADIETGSQDTQDAVDNGKYPFFVRSPIIERIDKYIFDGEAILMAGDGVGAGKVFHYINEKFGCHQRVYILHSFKNFFGKYLFYYMKNLFSVEIEKGSAKSTVDSVRLPMLKNFVICMPSIPEQQKIAAYLDKKCAEIDSLLLDIQSQISLLEEYKKSVITEAVTKGLNPDAKMKDSGIEWIGKIPYDWKVLRVKNVGEYRNGLTYSPMDLTDEKEGTLVLRSSNVKNGKIVLEDNVYVSCSIRSDLKVNKGDIIICSRNGSKDLVGKNAIVDEDMDASFGAFMMIFRCNCSKYMYYVLNSAVFSYYLGTFFTSTINQLTGNNFGNMTIVFCDNEAEQNQIAQYLDIKCGEIDAAIFEKKEQLEVLEQYKKSLIYEYVTGKREVCE